MGEWASEVIGGTDTSNPVAAAGMDGSAAHAQSRLDEAEVVGVKGRQGDVRQLDRVVAVVGYDGV